jgi:hypothetical protein
MQMLHFSLVVLLSLGLLVYANVEKVIFVAPPPDPLPLDGSVSDDLGLERLSPSAPWLRTHLNASFPTENTPRGTESWVFLENLHPGRRYEVRVCWLATVNSFFSSLFSIFPVLQSPV